jgi:hypothetical protein
MRVAEVWPEFGSRGKDRVTLRHVLLPRPACPAVMPNGPPRAGLAAVTRIDRLIADREEHQ